ncbi:MAG: twin-arginine translocase TatA/TatE family subunit [Chloroflexi bacterium]|nr:twin-arginine translocase TatA/TatE family subunit [Chloroflexota bacterium]
MPLGLGVPELLIILAIVILIFGVGKISQLGGALGKSIRDFKEAKEGDVVTSTKADAEKKAS